MVDQSTDAMPISEEPDADILRRSYEEKLLADEEMADLRHQVADREEEIQQLRRELDEHQQRIKDAEHQVGLTVVTMGALQRGPGGM